MTIRLYVDEDAMDNDLVQALRARGVDVVTALEVGMIEREDEEHLDHATAQGRVLYSFNVGDFYRLHTTYLAEGKSHAGIILARAITVLCGRADASSAEVDCHQDGGGNEESGGISQRLGMKACLSCPSGPPVACLRRLSEN